MAIYVSDNGGGKFTPHPTGLHQMVCCDVIDKGMEDTPYGQKRKVVIVWESVETNDKGNRMTVRQKYTASLNEKAKLRHDLEAWRGRAFTADELSNFDLENLIAANAMVNVVHRPDSKGNTWANVASLSPLMRGLPKLSVSSEYIRQRDRTDTPEPNEVPMSDVPVVTDDDIPF